MTTPVSSRPKKATKTHAAKGGGRGASLHRSQGRRSRLTASDHEAGLTRSYGCVDCDAKGVGTDRSPPPGWSWRAAGGEDPWPGSWLIVCGACSKKRAAKKRRAMSEEAWNRILSKKGKAKSSRRRRAETRDARPEEEKCLVCGIAPENGGLRGSFLCHEHLHAWCESKDYSKAPEEEKAYDRAKARWAKRQMALERGFVLAPKKKTKKPSTVVTMTHGDVTVPIDQDLFNRLQRLVDEAEKVGVFDESEVSTSLGDVIDREKKNFGVTLEHGVYELDAPLVIESDAVEESRLASIRLHERYAALPTDQRCNGITEDGEAQYAIYPAGAASQHCLVCGALSTHAISRFATRGYFCDHHGESFQHSSEARRCFSSWSQAGAVLALGDFVRRAKAEELNGQAGVVKATASGSVDLPSNVFSGKVDDAPPISPAALQKGMEKMLAATGGPPAAPQAPAALAEPDHSECDRWKRNLERKYRRLLDAIGEMRRRHDEINDPSGDVASELDYIVNEHAKES